MAINSTIDDLKKLIPTINDLSYLDEVSWNFGQTFKSCFHELSTQESCENHYLQIDSILDFLHDQLNTGHWSEVPLNFRYAFTIASFMKAIIILKFPKNDCIKDALKISLQAVDRGLLLGAPIPNSPDLLTQCASQLSKVLASLEKEPLKKISQKRKNSGNLTVRNIPGTEIETCKCPSLEGFNRDYLTSQKPVKLLNCMEHWPAFLKWSNLDYLIKIAGNRTVPIEIGSHYADNNWTQKLMLFKDFFREYFLGKGNNVGYLAQHNLFDQVPELKEDICIPEYCCLSEKDEEPDINAWLGPAGTLSPLHQDPKNNILAQVFGTKQLILFPPQDTPYLYPHDGHLLSNTATVDPLEPDLNKHPEFSKATPFKVLLKPGEMLFIPIKWWHHVLALEKSFSVSFWWD